jgi:hypothetical protein
MGTQRQATAQYRPIVVDSQADTRWGGMSAAHLEKLNDGQRAAVVHGIGRC